MAKKTRSFEESLNRLEEIVEALESEESTLTEAVRLYEEGTQLAAVCREELRSAELKVTQLRGADDAETETDFIIEG